MLYRGRRQNWPARFWRARGDFISGWMRRQQECLEKTLEGLDREEFRRAVEALAAARRVLIHGKNASGSLASLLLFRLRRLGIQVQLIPSGGSEIFEGLSQPERRIWW